MADSNSTNVTATNNKQQPLPINPGTAGADLEMDVEGEKQPDGTESNAEQAPQPSPPSSDATDTDSEMDDASLSDFEPPKALVLYQSRGDGWRYFTPIPESGQKPWAELPKVDCAPLETRKGTWNLQLNDIVQVCLDRPGEAYAKVTDMRDLEDGRFMVVYTWLYTKDEILEEYTHDDSVRPSLQKNLNNGWLQDTTRQVHYMLSSNRTVTLWDTALKRAPAEVTNSISDDHVYVTRSRAPRKGNRCWIYSVKDPRVEWLKRLLQAG
ncbi:hypothetical protein BDV06DRAFT_228696 [Aspergillus oleicola]